MTVEKTVRIGVISDTHGKLYDEAFNTLKGSDYIFHAGDIGDKKILERLNEIAPVIAVRGNTDNENWCDSLKMEEYKKIGEIHFYLIHNLHNLFTEPDEDEINVVISGHTHAPLIEKNKNILYLNPGSASQKRFEDSQSVAQIEINGSKLDPKILAVKI